MNLFYRVNWKFYKPIKNSDLNEGSVQLQFNKKILFNLRFQFQIIFITFQVFLSTEFYIRQHLRLNDLFLTLSFHFLHSNHSTQLLLHSVLKQLDEIQCLILQFYLTISRPLLHLCLKSFVNSNLLTPQQSILINLFINLFLLQFSQYFLCFGFKYPKSALNIIIQGSLSQSDSTPTSFLNFKFLQSFVCFIPKFKLFSQIVKILSILWVGFAIL